jgi:hypothetical protein
MTRISVDACLGLDILCPNKIKHVGGSLLRWLAYILRLNLDLSANGQR